MSRAAGRAPAPGTALLVVLLATLLSGCRPPVRGNGTNVLLITLETTRADHLGAYGYERDTSPTLDRLAAQGVLFEAVSAVSPRTNPSLASLMTARYPHEHGVRNLLLPLEGSERTLAEVLHDAGYRTGAIQTHPRLIASSGFAQGFEDYADDYGSHPTAERACAEALAWIRRRAAGKRPWFLWLHLMDPHWTYDPPAEWATRFGPDDPRPAELYRAIREREARIGPVIFRNRMPPDEVAAFIDRYDAEIAFTDAEIGKLLAELSRSGADADTLVVVSADHGESLGEHDYFFEHGDLGTQPEIHIPLVLVAPGRLPKGMRLPWSVPNIDVAPTILEIAGLGAEGAFVGRSLLPLLDPEVAEHRDSFGETGKRFHPENERREVDGPAGKWRWLRRGRFKLVHRPRKAGPPERVLYDLEADPGETRDVAPEHPELAGPLVEVMDRWIAGDDRPPREYHLTPESREVLRSLGYLD